MIVSYPLLNLDHQLVVELVVEQLVVDTPAVAVVKKIVEVGVGVVVQ